MLCHLPSAMSLALPLLELRYFRKWFGLMTPVRQEQARKCIRRGSIPRCPSENSVGSDTPVDIAEDTLPRRCSLVGSSLDHPWSSFLCILCQLDTEKCISMLRHVPCSRVFLEFHKHNRKESSRKGPSAKMARIQGRAGSEAHSLVHICSPA